jgi:hypothetical protein
MKTSKGVTRLVLLVGKYAIKFPNFTYSHLHFLNGCYDNWSERQYCKTYKKCKDIDFIQKVSLTLFCFWFGLLSIQKRVEVLTRDLTEIEKEYFKEQSTDTHRQNFGYLNGVLVCVDYP